MLHSSHYQVAQLRQRVNESTISVLLTTHYSLLTTYYLLLLTYYLLLTTFYFLGSQLRQRVNESTVTFELLHADDGASRLGVTCGEGGSGGPASSGLSALLANFSTDSDPSLMTRAVSATPCATIWSTTVAGGARRAWTSTASATLPTW